MTEQLAIDSSRYLQRGAVLIVFVLLLVLAMSTILLTSLSSRQQLEQDHRQETRQVLLEIREALIGFAMVNGRLPCPDITIPPDGIADFGATCANSEGRLPWVDLGVGQFDAWGHALTYRVTASFADNTDGTGCGVPTAGVSFELCSLGDIIVRDAAGTPVENQIPAIVVSQSKNWLLIPPGPLPGSVNERENVDNDVAFVDDQVSTVVPRFDDLVIWLPLTVLLSRMQLANQL